MNDQGDNVYAPTEVHVEDVAPAGTLQLASLGSRLGASLIDTVILLVAMAPLMFLMYGSWSAMAAAGNGKDAPDQFVASLVAVVAGIALYAAINWRLLERNGQTVGKRLLDIRIVRSDGSPAGAKRIVLWRYAPYSLIGAIPVLGTMLALINVSFIFRSSRKCAHDEIADTIVVKA